MATMDSAKGQRIRYLCKVTFSSGGMYKMGMNNTIPNTSIWSQKDSLLNDLFLFRIFMPIRI